ncbi:hypothetical protein DPMN_135435 [Dreissena polymorpha]|uniref:Uncharacterized protein n=1 Tax=Dreissena polymorpha TaxID=45954 RepID=A0A9D4FZ17_DREPO|nr:hypothetical protein DPMN_135435 [Dreissena polymorpha]
MQGQQKQQGAINAATSTTEISFGQGSSQPETEYLLGIGDPIVINKSMHIRSVKMKLLLSDTTNIVTTPPTKKLETFRL